MGQGVRIVVLLASTVVLARLLSPRDFGLLALVTSFIAFGTLFRDFGLGTAASRASDISHGQKSNLFWINFGMGVILSVVSLALAKPASVLFDEAALQDIIAALSITFLLSGASTQFRAEINRELRFVALTVADTLPSLLGLGSAIWFALAIERTYWSLVVQQLVIAACSLVLAMLLCRWKPGLPKSSESIREFVSYGGGIFGSQFIAYFTKNVDNLSIGYFWGSTTLGLYGRAYQVLMLPITQIVAPLTRVAVPILTRVREDRARFFRYLESAQLLAGVGLGIMYAVAIGLASPFIRIVFGDQWMPMVPIFQALAVGGVFRGLNQIVFWVYLATDNTGAQFRFYLWSQPLIVIAMLCGLPWGGVGVAAGHSIGYAVNWVVSVWWCSRVADIPVARFLLGGVKSLAAFTCPIIAIGLSCVWLTTGSWTQAGVGLGAIAIYLAVSYVGFPYVRSSFRELLGFAESARSRRQ